MPSWRSTADGIRGKVQGGLRDWDTVSVRGEVRQVDETLVRLSHFERVEKGEEICQGRKRGKEGRWNENKGSCGCETSSCLALLVGVKRAERKRKVNNKIRRAV
jgi:hypothetical protein